LIGSPFHTGHDRRCAPAVRDTGDADRVFLELSVDGTGGAIMVFALVVGAVELVLELRPG